MRASAPIAAFVVALAASCGSTTELNEADTSDVPVPDASDAHASDADAFDADAFDADADASDRDAPARACNGSPALCERGYDQVAFPTTHNSMSSDEDGWWAPNQLRNMEHQLEDGVRGFLLDVYRWEDDLYLCHGVCDIGSKRYVEGLDIFAEFLAAHPSEVITFIFESYVDADDHRAAFEESGLLDLAYAHPTGAPWPTLGEMIDADTRVVAFTSRDGGVHDWLMPVWDHLFETDWNNTSVEALDCRSGRGSDDNALFLLNHHVSNTPPLSVPLPSIAEVVNANPFFIEKARECERLRGHVPNFVSVDFYSIGDLFSVVSDLNALEHD